MHFARQVPSTPVSRVINVSALSDPRVNHPKRPSWAVLFMKAYSLVGMKHPWLRRALLEFPTSRMYEHPWMNCALAIERTFQGEHVVFVGLFRAPEQQSIGQLQDALQYYKNQPLERVGVYRRALKFSRVPRPIRRLFWWSTLNVSGYKRAKRFGTFGLTSYGALGAESLHPISPLTTTLTFGPISPSGEVTVKLIYDHRVLDGAYIARVLRDVENTLNGVILEELLQETENVANSGKPLGMPKSSVKLHIPVTSDESEIRILPARTGDLKVKGQAAV
ncbi:lipoamide acyltransferase component of branched-chain alpha-keto acid dehydrogenase complex [Singulisphaera rosea]